MYQCKYPHLFTPVRLGNTWFRNRLFAAPVGYEYFTEENYPTQEAVAFYERKAMGGAATVCIGSAAVDHRHGVIGKTDICLDDPNALPSVRRLATAISRHGAVANIELQHTGANSYICAARGEQLYGAVAGVNALGMEVPEMPEEVILRTIEAYADAAAFAKFCGFGMVTIHAGHGWLLSEFMGPRNNRKDRWGGSMENRCRMVNAIVSRIKDKCGRGFPVDVRISGSECWDRGYDIDYGVAIAKQLDGHCDMIHVSAGIHEAPEVFTVTHPSMFLPDGVNVKYAAEIKKHVSTPVGTVGALCDPALMEEIIASGQADVVHVARGLMADPDLPNKARAGRDGDIRKCLRCFACFSEDVTRRQMCCAVNPEIGIEQETMAAIPAPQPRTVLVAGGGVAGMQAALTAAERGHRVILCEKSGQLGGALRCEEKVPFKQYLSDYLDGQVRRLERAGVEIRLNTPATAELARALEPDVILAALGARPVKPTIPGIDSPHVLGAEEAYLDPDRVGQRVVILGGGLVGIELAIFLSGLGRRVTILEMMDTLSDGGNVVHGLALTNEIARWQIEAVTSTRAAEITPQGVVGEFVGSAFTPEPCPTVQRAVLQGTNFSRTIQGSVEPGSRTLYPGDTVIYAIGQAPLRAELDELRFCAPEFRAIGDCVSPRNIRWATAEAFAAARDIGR